MVGELGNTSMILYVFTFVLALAASFFLTPIVRAIAIRWGFVDNPDGGRKAHKTPIALGGGAAIFLSLLFAIGAASILLAFYGTNVFRVLGGEKTISLIAMFAASLVIVIVGLIDDFVSLRGRYKLLGQILAVSIILSTGLRIDELVIMGQPVQLAWLAIPFTIFWLLGSINAINLIDGIDGLATTVGFVLCLTLAAIAGWMGRGTETMLMLALAGALLGFLRYNFAPATIFLGDAGSMLIGLIIGTVAIFSSMKGATAVALAVPLAVWSIPILDSAAAILRRKLTGRSLFDADSGHLHHSLITRGWTVRQAVLFIGLISATTCLSAFLSFYYNNELIALVTIVAVAIFLVVTKTFGHIEMALLKQRFRWTAYALSSSGNGDRNSKRVHDSSVHLQGSYEWDKLWAAITEAAPNYHVVRLKLTIGIPSMRETFFATWEAKVSRKEAGNMWRISNPLIVDKKTVGKIEIHGLPNGSSAFPHMIQVLDFLEAIEPDIQHAMDELQYLKNQPNKKTPEPLVEENAEFQSHATETLTGSA